MRDAIPSRRARRIGLSSPLVLKDLSGDIEGETVIHRRLALRVIERALRDIVAPHCAAADRQTAREFLAGSSMLVHWCSVATLDPGRVTAWARAIDPAARRSARTPGRWSRRATARRA